MKAWKNVSVAAASAASAAAFENKENYAGKVNENIAGIPHGNGSPINETEQAPG